MQKFVMTQVRAEEYEAPGKTFCATMHGLWWETHYVNNLDFETG